MTHDPARPDPDALLAAVRAEGPDAPGRLKIWFGFAPGVGKTFAMLEAAQAAARAGTDVVVGVVETHGRQETAARLAGLPLLPPRTTVQGGSRFEELDVDAALARRPALLLVDELAHTNAPGSRHPKRWQDVLEILDAGIDVDTTLNVQHVESLHEPVARATGVRVRETVPDRVLDRADAIELIDLTPDELFARLHAGKVYLPAQAERALTHFFTPGNLLALRELALRRTAARVDDDVRAWRATHAPTGLAAGERVAVAVGASPASAGLVRAARRMADGLGVAWIAVHVQDPSSPAIDRDRARVDAHLALASSLGAETVRLTGRPFEDALVTWARKEGVSRLIVGRPSHPAWRDRLFGSRLDALVRAAGHIDVIVTSGSEGTVTPRRPIRWPAWTAWAEAALTVGGAATLAWMGAHWLADADVVVLFLLAITAVAARRGAGPSVFAAALSVATYDVLFVEPFGTFAVRDTRNLLTFAMMFAAGLLLSALMERLRGQQEAAIARERRTAALFELSRALAGAGDASDVADQLAAAVEPTIGAGARAQVLLRAPAPDLPGVGAASDGPRRDGPIPLRPPEGLLDAALPPEILAVAQWSADHGAPAGAGTDTLPATAATCFPIGVGSGVRGVLVIAAAGPPPGDEARALVEAFTRLAALALDRVALHDALRATALKARTEELRSSLLSTVSHDLRTPLAVITGAASVLAEGSPVDAATRRELLDDIQAQAGRMERLIADLLEMTRLSSGTVAAKRTWVPASEIVGAAMEDAARAAPARDVGVRIDPPGALLYADPLLIQHALTNLLENAARHTPAGAAIRLGVEVAGGAAQAWVEDDGPGLSVDGDPFAAFVRGDRARPGGSGLGLAIVRAVARAHGGEAWAERPDRRGTRIRLRWPQPSPPEYGPLEEG